MCTTGSLSLPGGEMTRNNRQEGVHTDVDMYVGWLRLKLCIPRHLAAHLEISEIAMSFV